VGNTRPATTPALDLADGAPSARLAQGISPVSAPAFTKRWFLAEIADLYDEDVRDLMRVEAIDLADVRKQVRLRRPGWYCRNVRSL
jgi:hypothetical protein